MKHLADNVSDVQFCNLLRREKCCWVFNLFPSKETVQRSKMATKGKVFFSSSSFFISFSFFFFPFLCFSFSLFFSLFSSFSSSSFFSLCLFFFFLFYPFPLHSPFPLYFSFFFSLSLSLFFFFSLSSLSRKVKKLLSGRQLIYQWRLFTHQHRVIIPRVPISIPQTNSTIASFL